jgi:hypothetical protein
VLHYKTGGVAQVAENLSRSLLALLSLADPVLSSSLPQVLTLRTLPNVICMLLSSSESVSQGNQLQYLVSPFSLASNSYCFLAIGISQWRVY